MSSAQGRELGCFARFLAAAAPIADGLACAAIFGTSYAGGGCASSSLGWTPQAPLALSCCRLGWILLAAGIAALHSSNRLPRFARVFRVLELVMDEAFSYVFLLSLGILGIMRLLTDEPIALPSSAKTGLWEACFVGLICTPIETWYTMAALPIVRRCAHRPASVRDAESAAALDIELLGAEGHGVGAEGTGGTTSPEQARARRERREREEKERNERKEQDEKKPTLKKLVELVTPDWPLLIQASTLLVMAAISEVLIPHYIGQTISSITRADAAGTLASRPFQDPLCRLLVSAGFCALFSALRGATFILIGCRASRRLRLSLFEALARQEIGFYDTTKTGELTSRMTQDCQKVSDQVTLNVNVFLRTLVQTATTLIFMSLLSAPLTLVAFVSVPAIVVLSKKYGKVMRTLSEQTQKALADANAVAEESLSTMSTVRSFAAEGLELQRFGAKLLEFVELMKRQARMYIFYLSGTMILPQVVTALVLFYGGKLAMEKRIQSDALLSFVFYLQTLNSNFSTLGDFYTNMVQAIGAATRVFELQGRTPELPLDPAVGTAAVIPRKHEGALCLENVHFAYPARPETDVLKGLTLEVPAGQVVALVGPSGNGKSTVIGLVKRLYKAREGRVTLDGEDVWSFPHRHFHRVISIVGQEPVLYARTVRENIVYGLENPGGVAAPDSPDGSLVTDEVIHEAARKANAHEFITNMPEGYGTEVGERGVMLSGGQKQRIAIARALVRQPRVLLLDEATSALDAESERQVQAAIDGMIVEGCMTVVIIAHRLSTVKNSHKICVIQGGVVVEQGTHDDLIAMGSAYFKLVQCQLSSGATPSGPGAGVAAPAAK